MNFKLIAKVLLVAAVLFVGIQFSLVYVNRTQLKSIIEAEALDARRARSSEEELLREIERRAGANNVRIPDGVEYTVEGIGDPAADLVVTADYVDVVDLKVYQIPMQMSLTAVAGAPE